MRNVIEKHRSIKEVEVKLKRTHEVNIMGRVMRKFSQIREVKEMRRQQFTDILVTMFKKKKRVGFLKMKTFGIFKTQKERVESHYS